MKSHALIIANGEPPRKQLLVALAKQAQVIVCADGGANAALRFGIQPHAIVGDMDSIHAQALVRFRNVTIVEDHDDNTTDLEKAIQWVIRQKIQHITVVAATGRRLDHSIGNLGVLVKFHTDAHITMVDDFGELLFVGSELRFEAAKGTTISLIPLTRCEGITTVGLQYGLKDESLELGVREGTSNRVIASPVVITVRSGSLLLYKVHHTHP